MRTWSSRELEREVARLRDDTRDGPGDWFDADTRIVTVAGIDEDGAFIDEDGEPVTGDQPDTTGWFNVPSPTVAPADAEDGP